MWLKLAQPVLGPVSESDQTEADAGRAWHQSTIVAVSLKRQTVVDLLKQLPKKRSEVDDDAFWTSLHERLEYLADIPELKPFAITEVTDATLCELKSVLESIEPQLERLERRVHMYDKGIRQIAMSPGSLVPDVPRIDLLVRYTAFNDNRLRMLLPLV